MRYVAMMCVVGAMSMMATSAQAQEPAAVMKQAAELKATAEAKAQNLRVTVESRTTKGAPYSAEAVTESIQLLADGNRIVSRNATRIFRDSEGRTRREQLNGAGTDVTTVNISDPVAGTTFVLDASSHTAFRNGMIFTTSFDTTTVSAPATGGTVVTTRAADGTLTVNARDLDVRLRSMEAENVARKVTDEMKVRADTVTFVAGGLLAARAPDASGQTTREELGQQTIEGVMAVGTRTTTEIPAGAIGNEQPIKILSEQWFSPELQVLVMTKHIDPRVGETVYRLTGIVRSEPPRSLFELPSDYTLKESVIRKEQR